MQLVITAVSVLVLGAAPSRPAAAPKGWRPPSATEAGQSWRSASPHRYLAVSADFDGDGRLDTAALLHRSGAPGGGLVVVFGHSPGKPLLLESFDDAAWLERLGVDLAAPGHYRTACGKGYWDCAPDEPEDLTLGRPAIDLFAFESANSLFVFEPGTRRFRRVSMSD